MNPWQATRLGLCLSLATSANAQNEAAFDQGYGAVRTVLQQARWSEARAAIDKLLEAHAERIYVQAQKDAIVADYRLCSFWCETVTPKASELIGPSLVSWAPSSGKVKLRYDSAKLAAWDTAQEGLWMHPAVFSGPFTISITAIAYPGGDDTLRVLFDQTSEGGLVADFGFANRRSGRGLEYVFIKAAVREYRTGTESALGSTPSTAREGQPFTAQVRVDKTQVELLFDKKPLLKVQRPQTVNGQIGITYGAVSEVLIEGQIEPSWFENVVDASLATQRERFEERFRATDKLPAWLFRVPELDKKSPRFEFTSAKARSRAAQVAFAFVVEGQLQKAITALTKLSEEDMDESDRHYLIGLCHQRAGQPTLALPFAEKALAADAEATFTRLLQADVWLDLNRAPEAIELQKRAVADDPGNMEAVSALFLALMRRSEIDAATRLVRDAKCKHGLWDETKELDTMLAMRARGPAWSRRFTNTSAHYRVHSDIDAKTCAEACRVLEESHLNLKFELAGGEEPKDFVRHEVFVFSGESSYQEYCNHILGSTAPHTAGLYSPVLKQLLIWNVPKREEMVRTIRHEGFHQFLDRVVPEAPTWFNEGMAEYWETAKREGGKIQGGQARPTHLATLARSKQALPSLRDLVYGSYRDFYANAPLRYPQAWGLVHFLRKGPPAHQKLFTALWQELRAGTLGARGALDKVFAGVDWAKLETEFWAHHGKGPR